MSVDGLQDLSLAFGNLLTKVIPQQWGIVVRKISVEAYTGVVMKTPVKKGRARANWSLAVAKPSTAVTDNTDQQPFGSPPPSGAITAATMIANGAKTMDTIYITNSLPYILPLEEGHSKQGAHMVALTVDEIKRHYGI